MQAVLTAAVGPLFSSEHDIQAAFTSISMSGFGWLSWLARSSF